MTMRDSQRNLEVVKSTIDLAHRLGAVAVAEGIEDGETMALLAGLGCDVGQGYHLGKPPLFSELAATLTALPHNRTDRQSVVEGNGVTVPVDPGGHRINK